MHEALSQLLLARGILSYRRARAPLGLTPSAASAAGTPCAPPSRPDLSPSLAVCLSASLRTALRHVNPALPILPSCPLRSYIFAYYLFGGAWFKDDFAPAARELNQALFEDKQGQLEMEASCLCLCLCLCSCCVDSACLAACLCLPASLPVSAWLSLYLSLSARCP